MGSRDPISEFWDPLIYSERLKLETSNLARRWTTVSSIEKNSKFCQRGHVGVTWQIFEFWDPLISHERLKLESSNLVRWWTSVSSNEKNSKLGQKGSCSSHMTQFWNFGTLSLLISRERLKLETLSLALRRTAVSCNEKNSKLYQKGSCWGHVTLF